MKKGPARVGARPGRNDSLSQLEAHRTSAAGKLSTNPLITFDRQRQFPTRPPALPGILPESDERRGLPIRYSNGMQSQSKPVKAKLVKPDLEFVVDLRQQQASDRELLKVWRKAKRRVGRAEIPKDYWPASDTENFWLYPFGLVIEILPKGYQFAHLWKPGDAGNTDRNGYGRSFRTAEDVAEVFGRTLLNGDPGLPGEIRQLPRGKKLVIWKARTLRPVELLLESYGPDYRRVMCAWLANWREEWDAEALALEEVAGPKQ